MTEISFKAPKKEKITGVVAIILYLVTGILLLARQEMMAEFTRWALFAVLLVYAVVSARKYFKLSAQEAAKGYSLTAAMIAATLAVLALFNTELLTDHIWGVLLLAGGYVKFQTAMDMGRLGHQRWWLFLIPAAISLIFGVLIVVDVIRTNTSLFIGIALIAEAVVDLAAMIMMDSSEKLNEPAKKKEAKSEAAEEAQKETAPEEDPAEEASAEEAPAEESPAEEDPAEEAPAEAENETTEETAEPAE